MTKIKRSQFRTFLNTATPGSPTWALVGDGVTTGSIAYNPKTTEETYIHEDSATISVESYAPTMPIEATAVAGDGVFEFVDTLRKGRSVLADAEAEVVNVWMYKPAIGGFYPAEKQNASLQVDEFGGDGGTATKLNFTVNFVGDPTIGRFSPTLGWSDLNATAATTLTTLVLGSGTLSPLFATDESNLFYTTSIAAATVTVASTLATADSIVQKCNGDVVAQSDPASLDLGENTISIEVTEGAVTTIYYIKATRTE